MGSILGYRGATFLPSIVIRTSWRMQTIDRAKSDLRLALNKFLTTLPPDAPLREVVTSREVATQIATFDRIDAVAVAMQRAYSHAERLARWASLLVAVVVPLKLMPIEGLLPSWSSMIVNGLWLLSIFLTLLAIGWISLRQPVAQRMQHRAQAERVRADVFRAIIRLSPNVPGALEQGVACFKSAHLNWHIDYYLRRAQELRDNYATAARTTARVRTAGYFLSGCAALIGLIAIANIITALGFSVPYLSLFQWFVVSEPDRWQLGLNAASLSILAFASSLSPVGTIDSDIRNVSTYPWAANELTRQRVKELPLAEISAASGKVAEVVRFCETVQSVIDAEHLAWVSTSLLPEE
jgi:hypothetical protein